MFIPLLRFLLQSMVSRNLLVLVVQTMYKLFVLSYMNLQLILRTVLNNSWKQRPTKQQLCGHLPPISQVRRTRHSGIAGEVRTNSWTTFSYGRASVGQLAKIYILQLGADTGCSLGIQQEAMDDGWLGGMARDRGSWNTVLSTGFDDYNCLRMITIIIIIIIIIIIYSLEFFTST